VTHLATEGRHRPLIRQEYFLCAVRLRSGYGGGHSFFRRKLSVYDTTQLRTELFYMSREICD